MSIIGSNILAGASGQGGGYTIENSLRFRSSASAYLNKTLTTPTDTKKFTWSGWVKRGIVGSAYNIFFNGTPNAYTDYANFGFSNGSAGAVDSLTFDQYVQGSGFVTRVTTSAVYRDPSAWYHIVLVWDSANATEANRVLIYVNGLQVTSFSTATYPAPNTSSQINLSSSVNYLSNYAGAYFDGYLAEVNFIDGSTPATTTRVVNGVTQTILTEFGEFNADTGVWQPVAYSGSYGTNGFYLPFSDATNTTTLVADSSGNGNDWTPNNISLTSGVTYDSMTDTPTIYAGGGNYAVLNPLDKVGSGVLTDANLDYATSSGTFDPLRGTIGVSSGKWYWEVTCKATSGASPNTFTIGIASQSTNINDASWYVGKDAASYSYYGVNGVKYNNNASTAYGASYTTGDVIGVALDMDAGTLVFYKNNTSQGTAFSSLVGTFMPAFSDGATSGTVSVAFNFGQRPFAYTPPTGFLPLHTGNLPDSAIVDGSEYFNAVLWTGNGGTQSITGVGFQPDWLWVKERSEARSNLVWDAVRGSNLGLITNTTSDESAQPSFTGFLSDGFGVSNSDASDITNKDTQTYVAWNWKANGAGVSNDEGSITSTVSANLTSGFSIVTYTGNYNGASGTGTLGHGLNTTPSLIIIKNRDSAYDWAVGHSSVGWTQAGLLNLPNGFGTSSYFNSTAPTESVFSVGQSNITNQNLSSHVAYCFAEVPGYSKFGSYTGNGLSDGPFVYLGFRPRYLLLKVSSITGYDWLVYDSSRDTYNVTDLNLRPNFSYDEGSQTANYLDFLSNGFKIRGGSSGSINPSQTIIYAAFAENPFKNSLAR